MATTIRHAAPWLVCLLHVALLTVPARQHPFGNFATETDFYHLFAPDAARLLDGQFPENPFQGPGYPATIAVISKLTGAEFFVVGKWLSVVCAGLIGVALFLLFSRLCGFWTGLGAQLLLIVSGEFPQFSINASTDLHFLLICLAGLVALFAERLSPGGRATLVGLLCGLAWLSRYNGIFLPAACVAGIVLLDIWRLPMRERLVLAARLLVVFLLTVSPWFYFNAKHRGSPLYNKNYLNMATQFYPELVAGKTNQDGTRALEEKFKSFGEVLRHDPGRIASRYPATLRESLSHSLGGSLVHPAVGALAWLGILLALIWRRKRETGTLLIAGALYFLMMGLNHWETRYYFFIGALYAGFAVYALTAVREWAGPRLAGIGAGARFNWWRLLPLAPFLLVWWLSFDWSRKDMARFLADQPWEIAAARDYLLASRDSATSHPRIVARKPHLPYMVGGEWVFFPTVKSLDEFREWLTQNHVDYVVIGRRELKERKELASLAKPEQAPAWLEAVWSYDDKARLILYRVSPPH